MTEGHFTQEAGYGSEGMIEILLRQKCTKQLHFWTRRHSFIKFAPLECVKCRLLIPEKHPRRIKELGFAKCRACYLAEFSGLVYSAPLSPESPTFALSGIK